MEEKVMYNVSEINKIIEILNSIKVQGLENIIAISDIFAILRNPQKPETSEIISNEI